MKRIAIIDICGTLFDSNTTFDFIKWFDTTTKSMFLYNLLFTWPGKILNKLSIYFLGIDIIRVLFIKRLKKVNKAALLAAANEFYSVYLSPRKIKEVHEILEQLKRDNYEIVLVSATMDFLAEIISNRLDINSYYATTLNYQNNICTGKIGQDLLGRKDALVKGFIGKYSEVLTITDNKSDIKLIEMSSNGYIVSKMKDLVFWRKYIRPNFIIINV